MRHSNSDLITSSPSHTSSGVLPPLDGCGDGLSPSENLASASGVQPSSAETLQQAVDDLFDLHGRVPPIVKELMGLLPLRSTQGPSWLTISQAARWCALSAKTIRRAIKARENNRLVAYDVGSPAKPTWRIRAADLDHWMTRRGPGADVPPPPQKVRARQRSRYFEGF